MLKESQVDPQIQFYTSLLNKILYVYLCVCVYIYTRNILD